MIPKFGRIYAMTPDGVIREAQKVVITYGLNDDNTEGFSDTYDLPEVSVKSYAYRVINDDGELQLLPKEDVIVISPWILSHLFVGLK